MTNSSSDTSGPLIKPEHPGYPLELIVWEDHVGNDGHCDINDGPDASLIHSVGWVTGEDDHYVAFAPHVQQNTWRSSHRRGAGKMTVLKSCIVHRQQLAEPTYAE